MTMEPHVPQARQMEIHVGETGTEPVAQTHRGGLKPEEHKDRMTLDMHSRDTKTAGNTSQTLPHFCHGPPSRGPRSAVPPPLTMEEPSGDPAASPSPSAVVTPCPQHKYQKQKQPLPLPGPPPPGIRGADSKGGGGQGMMFWAPLGLGVPTVEDARVPPIRDSFPRSLDRNETGETTQFRKWGTAGGGPSRIPYPGPPTRLCCVHGPARGSLGGDRDWDGISHPRGPAPISCRGRRRPGST